MSIILLRQIERHRSNSPALHTAGNAGSLMRVAVYLLDLGECPTAVLSEFLVAKVIKKAAAIVLGRQIWLGETGII